MSYPPKVTNEQVTESYNRLGSLWKVGNELGICGQSVWERLKKLGITDKDKWTNEQLSILREAYSVGGNEPLNINELSAKLNRTKSNVCRKARELGLVTSRKRDKPEYAKQLYSDCKKLQLQKYGWKHGYRELRQCQCCGRMMELPHSHPNKTCSRSCAAKLRMRGEHIFSRCNFGRRIDLNNQFFRSTYEANYARYLNYVIANSLLRIISWQYEPDTFKFPKATDTPKQYTPDFKVFYENYHCQYHEVKGWDYPKGIKAREKFSKYFPKLKLILIGEDFFANAVKDGLSKLIPNWEYYKQHKKLEEDTNESI